MSKKKNEEPKVIDADFSEVEQDGTENIPENGESGNDKKEGRFAVIRHTAGTFFKKSWPVLLGIGAGAIIVKVVLDKRSGVAGLADVIKDAVEDKSVTVETIGDSTLRITDSLTGDSVEVKDF